MPLPVEEQIRRLGNAAGLSEAEIRDVIARNREATRTLVTPKGIKSGLRSTEASTARVAETRRQLHAASRSLSRGLPAIIPRTLRTTGVSDEVDEWEPTDTPPQPVNSLRLVEPSLVEDASPADPWWDTEPTF